MKRDYVKAEVKVIILSDIMQVIVEGSDTNTFDAKKNDLFFDESAEDEDNTAETGSLWDEPMWQ